jgi:hypothetical protein
MKMELALTRKCALAVIVSMLAAVAVAAAPAATQPLLSILSLHSEEDYLCVDFYLKNALEKDLLASIRNGVPALLSYQVEVWQNRDSWYDKLVKSNTYSYKIAYDNWDTLYCVDALAQGKTETGRAKNVADLLHLLCNQRALKVCPMSALDRDGSYYVTISAAIQALSAERVKEIETWLGGGRGSQDPSKAGGLLGFVVDIFTSRAKRAEAKSSIFALEALSRAP